MSRTHPQRNFGRISFDSTKFSPEERDHCHECRACLSCTRRCLCISIIALLALGVVGAVIGFAVTFGLPPPTPVNRFCVTSGNQTGFLCDDRVTCLPASRICNRIRECVNGEDEQEKLCNDLPSSLPGYLIFRCSNPVYWIYADKKCNGANDCGDCSDEKGALWLAALLAGLSGGAAHQCFTSIAPAFPGPSAETESSTAQTGPMSMPAIDEVPRAKRRGKLQVTMQSSSAEVTMMESQNRKRAPALTEWEGMKDRGHNRDPKQCRVKLKQLRQAYQKTRGANGRSGSEPQTCRFYDELHAILGGSATTTPAVLFDSFNGDGGNTEAGFGDEEDEVVDSSQQASGETGFPDSQELFLTLDLEPVPPEPTQGCLLDSAGGEGTSAACVSMITGSSPSQRLVKLRKKKKRTRDEMFSELMLSSHTDRAQTNAWRQIMSECRKAQNDQEERWRAEESKWRAEDRAEAQRWRQRDERRQDSMLRLLQDQTSMLQSPL
ncbi:unnamed protein product [Caretta caretta]